MKPLLITAITLIATLTLTACCSGRIPGYYAPPYKPALFCDRAALAPAQ